MTLDRRSGFLAHLAQLLDEFKSIGLLARFLDVAFCQTFVSHSENLLDLESDERENQIPEAVRVPRRLTSVVCRSRKRSAT